MAVINVFICVACEWSLWIHSFFLPYLTHQISSLSGLSIMDLLDTFMSPTVINTQLLSLNDSTAAAAKFAAATMSRLEYQWSRVPHSNLHDSSSYYTWADEAKFKNWRTLQGLRWLVEWAALFTSSQLEGIQEYSLKEYRDTVSRPSDLNFSLKVPHGSNKTILSTGSCPCIFVSWFCAGWFHLIGMTVILFFKAYN